MTSGRRAKAQRRAGTRRQHEVRGEAYLAKYSPDAVKVTWNCPQCGKKRMSFSGRPCKSCTSRNERRFAQKILDDAKVLSAARTDTDDTEG